MANKQITKGNDRPLEVESCPECEGMVLADGTKKEPNAPAKKKVAKRKKITNKKKAKK